MDSRGSILQGGGAPSAASAGQCRRKRIPSASPGKPPRWLTAASVALAAPFAAPFGYLVVRNLRAEGGLREAAVDPRVIGPLLRTLALAGSVSAAAAVLGVAAAWLAVRSDLPGRRAWAVLLPLPLVIPSFIAALAAIAAFAPGGLLAGLLGPAGVGLLPSPQGFWAAFTLLALITFPYVYLPVAARLRQLPPSLEEAARMLGHPPWAVFFRVVLPQAKIAVLGGGLLVFLYTLSDFGAVQLLRYHTLTWAIYATRLFDPPTSLALGLGLGALALAVVAGERALTRGASPSRGRHGLRGLRVPLGGWKGPALAFIGLLVGTALVAPVSVLLFWAIRGFVRGSLGTPALAALVRGLLRPAANTAWASVAAAVAAILAVAPAAFLTVRHKSVSGGLSNAVIVGGFALPGLTIALALAFWSVRAPGLVGVAYQGPALLIFAYVVHFGAQALRASQVAVAGVPLRVGEAARVLGARRVRRLISIHLPLMTPGILAGGGLVLLSVMKELPATLLLAPAGFQTLATKIWTAAEDGFLADASIASLVLIALSGVLTWLLVIRRWFRE